MTLTAGKVFHGGATLQKHFHVVGPRPGQWLKGLDKKVHDKPKGWHGIWDFGPQDYDESKFTDHVVATWVTEQLGNKHDKPFFLAFGFYRPHVPFSPPRRVYDRFENVQLPRVDDDDWNDIPDAAREVSLSNPKIPTHDWMRENDRWEQAALGSRNASEECSRPCLVGLSAQRLRGRPNRFTSQRQTLSSDRHGGTRGGHRDNHSDHQLRHRWIRDC